MIGLQQSTESGPASSTAGPRNAFYPIIHLDIPTFLWMRYYHCRGVPKPRLEIWDSDLTEQAEFLAEAKAFGNEILIDIAYKIEGSIPFTVNLLQ